MLFLNQFVLRKASTLIAFLHLNLHLLHQGNFVKILLVMGAFYLLYHIKLIAHGPSELFLVFVLIISVLELEPSSGLFVQPQLVVDAT